MENLVNPNQITQNSTVEVLDSNGKTLDRGTSSLANLFDKMEEAKGEGRSTEDVIKDDLSKRHIITQEEKPAEKVVEKIVEEPNELEKKLGIEVKNKTEEKPAQEKVAEKPADKPADAEKKIEDVKQDDVPDDELQVLPHDKPKTAKRIQALLKKIDSINAESSKTKAERDEKNAKLAEYEKKLTEFKPVDPKTDEAVKKQLDELAMYRRRYGLENDPEVKTKFDDRIAATVATADSEIPTILSKNQASPALLELIKNEGGWSKFSQSNKPVTLSDGNTVSSSELAEIIVSKLPFTDKSRLQSFTIEQIQLQREKERYFKEEQAKATDYFKNLEESNKKQTIEQQQKMQEMSKTIETWVSDIKSKNDWLKEKPIPASATAEQKAAIEEENKYTNQLNSLLEKNLKVSSINESLDLVFDATRYYQERRQTAKLLEENAKLKAQLDAKAAEVIRAKNSGRSVPKSGSLIGGGSKDIQLPTKAKPTSLEDAFSAIERGDFDKSSILE